MSVKILTTTFLLVVSYFLSACGDSDTTDACNDLSLQSRIVYGTACQTTEESPIARLELLNSKGKILGHCSGALIAKDRILTAAHCVLGDVRSIVAEIGGEKIAVNSFAAHPGNHVSGDGIESSEADVAVLALSRRALVEPLPVNKNFALTKGQRFSIFGFGLDQDGNSGTLRSGEMFIDKIDGNVIRSEHIKKSSGICFGDSGGPAILLDNDGNPSVIGVASAIEAAGLFGGPLPGLPLPLPFVGEEQDCELGAKNYHANIQADFIIEFLKDTVPELIVE